MSCVYKLIFPDNSVYIGKTDGDPKDRWRNGWGYDQRSMVFKTIFYFGWKNVKHEIIADGLTHEDANKREIHEITVHSAHCTVLNEIGTPNAQLIPENSEKIEEKRIEKLKRKRKNKPLLNKRVIPLVPKPEGAYRCSVDVFGLDGTFIRTYNSAKEASQDLNVNRGDIASCCIGIKPDGARRYQAGGYIFRYHNPEYTIAHNNEGEE